MFVPLHSGNSVGSIFKISASFSESNDLVAPVSIKKVTTPSL